MEDAEINWADVANTCQTLVGKIRSHVAAGMVVGAFRRERFVLKVLCQLGIIRRGLVNATTEATTTTTTAKEKAIMDARMNHVLKWCPFEVAAALLFVSGSYIEESVDKSASSIDVNKVVEALDFLEDSAEDNPANRSLQYVSIPERRLCVTVFNGLFLWKERIEHPILPYLPLLPTYITIGALYPLLIQTEHIEGNNQVKVDTVLTTTTEDDTEKFDENKSQNTISDSLLASPDFLFIKPYVSVCLMSLITSRQDGVLALVRVLLFDDRINASFTMEAIGHVTKVITSCAGKSEANFRHVCSQISVILKSYYKGKDELEQPVVSNDEVSAAASSTLPNIVKEAASRAQRKSVFGVNTPKELTEETIEDRLHMALVATLEGLAALRGIPPTVATATSKPLSGLVLLNKCFLGPSFAPLTLRRAADGLSVVEALRALWGVVHGSSLSIISGAPSRRIVCLVWDVVAHGLITAYCELKRASRSSESTPSEDTFILQPANPKRAKRLVEEISSDLDNKAMASRHSVVMINYLVSLIEGIFDATLLSAHTNALTLNAEELLLVFVEAARPQDPSGPAFWSVNVRTADGTAVLTALPTNDNSARLVSMDPHTLAEFIVSYAVSKDRQSPKVSNFFVQKLFGALVGAMLAQQSLKARELSTTTANTLTRSPHAALAVSLLGTFDSSVLMGLQVSSSKGSSTTNTAAKCKEPIEQSILAMISFLSLLATMDEGQTLLLIGSAIPQLMSSTETLLQESAAIELALPPAAIVEEMDSQSTSPPMATDVLRASIDLQDRILLELQALHARLATARESNETETEIIEAASTSIATLLNHIVAIQERYSDEVSRREAIQLQLGTEGGLDIQSPEITQVIEDLRKTFAQLSRAHIEATSALMARAVAAEAVAMRRILSLVRDLADGSHQLENSKTRVRSLDLLIEEGLDSKGNTATSANFSICQTDATVFAKILQDIATLCFRMLVSLHDTSAATTCSTDLFVQSNAIQILAVMMMQRLDGSKGLWLAGVIKRGLMFGLYLPGVQVAKPHTPSQPAIPSPSATNFIVPVAVEKGSDIGLLSLEVLSAIADFDEAGTTIKLLDSTAAYQTRAGNTMNWKLSLFDILCQLAVTNGNSSDGAVTRQPSPQPDRRITVAALQLLGRVVTLLRPRVSTSVLLTFCGDVFRSSSMPLMAKAAVSASITYVTIWSLVVEVRGQERKDDASEMEDALLLANFAKNLSAYTPLPLQSGPQQSGSHDDPDLQHIEVIRSHGALIKKAVDSFTSAVEARARNNDSNSVSGLRQDVEMLRRLEAIGGRETAGLGESPSGLRVVAERLLSTNKRRLQADLSQFSSVSLELASLKKKNPFNH